MTLLAGKRGIVTGAGSGIGRETALVCAREGARIGVLDIDPTRPTKRSRRLRQLAARPWRSSPISPTSRTSPQAVDRLSALWGGLDAVIGCAGVQLAGQDDRADRLSLDVWQRTIDVNLTGMFLISKHGIRELLKSGGGTVVLTCSPTGLFGCAPGYDAYSVSKAGCYGLVRVLAADYAANGIRVNGVVPGYTRTAMTDWVTPAEHDALLQTIPMRRAGLPEEVAEVIAFLASDRTSYTTGAVWSADGGMTAI